MDTISWLQRERVTILHTVPSLAAAWLDSLESNARLPDLRWALMAGEPLTDMLVSRGVKRWERRTRSSTSTGPPKLRWRNVPIVSRPIRRGRAGNRQTSPEYPGACH